jgi:hypothetical protein
MVVNASIHTWGSIASNSFATRPCHSFCSGILAYFARAVDHDASASACDRHARRRAAARHSMIRCDPIWVVAARDQLVSDIVACKTAEKEELTLHPFPHVHQRLLCCICRVATPCGCTKIGHSLGCKQRTHDTFTVPSSGASSNRRVSIPTAALQCLDRIWAASTGKRVNAREECHWSHACKSFK